MMSPSYAAFSEERAELKASLLEIANGDWERHTERDDYRVGVVISVTESRWGCYF